MIRRKMFRALEHTTRAKYIDTYGILYSIKKSEVKGKEELGEKKTDTFRYASPLLHHSGDENLAATINQDRQFLSFQSLYKGKTRECVNSCG